MNITTTTSNGTQELRDVSELHIEFDCDAQLTCIEPMNKNIHTDTWTHKIVARAKLELAESENKLSTKEHAKQFPYIILRLDTFEKINFSDTENAIASYNRYGASGIPRVLFQFNQNSKSYNFLYFSTI